MQYTHHILPHNLVCFLVPAISFSFSQSVLLLLLSQLGVKLIVSYMIQFPIGVFQSIVVLLVIPVLVTLSSGQALH
jgi:hypothetical protein